MCLVVVCLGKKQAECTTMGVHLDVGGRCPVRLADVLEPENRRAVHVRPDIKAGVFYRQPVATTVKFAPKADPEGGSLGTPDVEPPM